MHSSPTRDQLSVTAPQQLAITFARHYGLSYSRPAIGPSSWSHRNMSASFLPRTDSHRPVSLNDMRWCELEGKIQISRLSLKYYYTLSIFVMASNMEFKFFNVFLPIPSPKRTWDSPFYVKNNSFFFLFFVDYQVFFRPRYSKLSCDPRKRKLVEPLTYREKCSYNQYFSESDRHIWKRMYTGRNAKSCVSALNLV